MADTEENTRKKPKPTKKKGLPPLSQTGDGEENEQSIKPVKKRVKKNIPTEYDERVESPNEETKPTPARRRNRSPSQKNKAGEDAEQNEDTIMTKKKKKKPKKKTEDEESDQNMNQNSNSPSQSQRDGQGSKTSLIGKEEETPRKKAGGKKKKKVKKAPTCSDDEYGDSPWAEDMRTLGEDVITGTGDLEDEEGDQVKDGDTTLGIRKMTQMFVTAPVMKSQALDKIFVETSTKFKGQTKNDLKKQQYQATDKIAMAQEVSRSSTADFAFASNSIWRTCTLFLYGLMAGLALWQMVMILTLTSFGTEDFLMHYQDIAMPLQGTFYFLLAVCTVSVCDRFDIGNPTRQFVLRAFTLQNGAVSILFCLVALVLNVVALGYEDRMNLYMDYANIYSSEDMKSSDIDTFKSINTARSVFILLSWLVLSLTPGTDRLGESLKSGRTGLEGEVEMDKVVSA